MTIGNWAVIILAWLGTCFCGMAFGMGYIFTLELFPTLYRTTALGMASAAARVGSLSSPLIAMLSVVHPVLPLGVYGAIVLAAGVSSILLWPETLNMNFTGREITWLIILMLENGGHPEKKGRRG